MTWKLPGLPAMRLHDMRHVAASLTLANGGSVYDVMRLLGHSSIAVTVDTSGHLVEGRSRELADVMDRLLRVMEPAEARPGTVWGLPPARAQQCIEALRLEVAVVGGVAVDVGVGVRRAVDADEGATAGVVEAAAEARRHRSRRSALRCRGCGWCRSS